MKNFEGSSEESGLLLDSLYRHQAILQDGSVEQSTIPAKLIIHYAAAHYRAWIEKTEHITLLIGQYCAPLATLLHAYGSQSAVYITAYNPLSQVTPPEENRLANTRLYERLFHHSGYVYPGESIDPTGEWPAEASYLALDLNPAAARKLGCEFSQNAIVWVGADAIPRLILLQ